MKVLAGVWVAALAALSLQPIRPHHGSGLAHFHRGGHIILFGITALILWRVMATVRWPHLPNSLASRPWRLAILATISLGFTLEFLQSHIYPSRIEWWDVRDDAIGAILAYLLVRFALALRPAATP